MKKIVFAGMVLVLLAGCSQGVAETTEPAESNAATVSNDFDDGALPLIKDDIYCKVPSAWTVEEKGANTYCYPPDTRTSFLMLSSSDMSGSVFEEVIFDSFLDGLGTGFEDFSVISTGETENIYGSKGKTVQFTGTIKGVDANVNLVAYDSLGGVSVASMLTDSKSQIDYSSDFDKIVQSVYIIPRVSGGNEPATPEPESTPQITIGQSNALKKAGDYLALTAFSYSGLIEQLEYEGFTAEEAKYAVDNCGADWNEQAAQKAQDYLNLTSFSRQGLIDQLLFEGFTQEQAEYGVTAVGY